MTKWEINKDEERDFEIPLKETNGCHTVEDAETGETYTFWDWIRWNTWFKKDAL